MWELNVTIFEIFRILQHYFTEYYGLDSYLMCKLIKERNADLEEVLMFIPYLHSAYVSQVVPTSDKTTPDN